jgi:hypothetical protein
VAVLTIAQIAALDACEKTLAIFLGAICLLAVATFLEGKL